MKKNFAGIFTVLLAIVFIGATSTVTGLLPSLNAGKVLELHFNNFASYGESKSLVYDSSGNGNNGSVNGATFNRNIGLKGAYEFDGVNDLITVNDADGLSPSTTGAFTVAYWAKFKQRSFQGEDGFRGYVNYLGK